METQQKKHKRKPITLADHFTTGRLLRFVLPSIVMMVFISIYGVVDGLFVSNVVGKTAFASINLIMPFLMVFGGIGFMIGTGGSAVVARTLGEGDRERANRIFSMLIYVTVVVGVIFSAIGIAFLEPIARLLGADDAMMPYCLSYGRRNLIALTAFMLQNVFQSFLVTAEKPKMGLAVTVAAGCTNMVLDYLFVAVFRWGVAGAAVATGLSQCVGGVIPLVYFLLPQGRFNTSCLKLTKAGIDWNVLFHTVTNGSSELMSSISSSVVNMLYNKQLLHFEGENGVAAYGAIMYINFIFIAIFIGYAIGSAPIIGYNYGSGNTDELKNMFKKSILFNLITGVCLAGLAISLSGLLTGIFVGYDAELEALTRHGFCIYALAFTVCGINIFGSSMFTALSNGLVSALISFLRTLLFQVTVVLVLPIFFDVEGVWASVLVAEVFALCVTTFFFVRMRKRYNYV